MSENQLNKELNKAAVAAVSSAKERYDTNDANLMNALNNEAEYIAKHVDPIMSDAIQQLLLHQPEQVAEYLSKYMNGTPQKQHFEKSFLSRQQYFDRKVRHALALGVKSVVHDKPSNIKAYLAEMYANRTHVY